MSVVGSHLPARSAFLIFHFPPHPKNFVFPALEDARAAFNSLVDSCLSPTVIARHTDYQQSVPLLLHGGDGGI